MNRGRDCHIRSKKARKAEGDGSQEDTDLELPAFFAVGKGGIKNGRGDSQQYQDSIK